MSIVLLVVLEAYIACSGADICFVVRLAPAVARALSAGTEGGGVQIAKSLVDGPVVPKSHFRPKSVVYPFVVPDPFPQDPSRCATLASHASQFSGGRIFTAYLLGGRLENSFSQV